MTGALTPVLGAILRAEDPRLLGATTADTEAATTGLQALGLLLDVVPLGDSVA
jgi:hypothetical protein